MTKNKLWTWILWAALGLEAVAMVTMVIVIARLNMLPGIYMVVVLVLLALLLAATAALIFLRTKKPVGNGRRICACVLALVVILGCCVASKVAIDARRAINKVANHVTTTTRNVYVFVLSEDPAQTLQDAADYAFGMIADYDVRHTTQAVAYIEETVGQSIALTGYESGKALADALFNRDARALIMNGASVALLIEDEDYADFTEKVRILETMPFSQLEDEEPTQPTEPEPDKTVVNTPFAVYLSGSDTRSSMLDVSRSDVNILAVVNPVTKQILLLNTPRDYYVANPAGDGAMDKLTHCGLYGVECSMEVLSELYDVPVNYYAQINFDGFEKLVDAVGGVTVHSDQAFKAGASTYIAAGENKLNGSQALDFARERYHVAGGDNGRGKNQMKVIKAVIEKATTGTTIISNYSSILESLEGMFVTSLQSEDISMLVKMQLSDLARWNVQSFAVTGVGSSKKTYSMPGSYAYVMFEDEAVTAYASKLVQRVIEGEILTEADMQMPGK